MLSTVETWGALKFNAIDFARYPFWTGDCKMDESSTLVANRVASGKYRHLCDLVLVPPSSNAWATEAVLLFRRPRFRVCPFDVGTLILARTFVLVCIAFLLVFFWWHIVF